MENGKGIIGAVITGKNGNRLIQQTGSGFYAVLFLFSVCLFVQCFACTSDVSAQTSSRKTINGERTLWVAQSIPMDRGQFLREAFGSGFNSNKKSSSEVLYIFFFLILILLFLCGLIYYDTAYLKQRQDLENPWVVFRELCRAHQLSRSEKSFLRRAADELDLDDPLPLFIEPKFLKSLLENRDFAAERFVVLKLLHQFFGIEPPDRTSSIISAVKKI